MMNGFHQNRYKRKKNFRRWLRHVRYGCGSCKWFTKKKRYNSNEIDFIIFCTVTPDMVFPSTACILADKIGAKNAFGFDLAAACSGFIFGLETGSNFITEWCLQKSFGCWC
jgi:3-hydroxy-3-methylglutaryl CoA synthase